MSEMADREHGITPDMRNASSTDLSLERMKSFVVAIQERFDELSPARKRWFVSTLLVIAAICAAMVWYIQRPDWHVLFNGVDAKDIQQISQELAAAGIPYQMTMDGGGVEVPAQMLDKARMEVAAKGMPQSGRMGFELFDKPNWIGSEFDEKVNYQRALEGELEQTIETLGIVKSARVHLVLPQPSLFSSEEKAAKASVVLKLKRGSLEQEQIDAIRSLIAGSVENLAQDQVNLVDADGRVNFKQRSNSAAEADAESAMESKLVAMLEPLAGRDNVRATVNISYDESNEERTDEVYDPTSVATLSMQKSEQVTTPRSPASGIPGTASNSPAGSPEGAAAGSQAAAAPGTPPLLQKQTLPVYPAQGQSAGQSLREENGTYGVTKHLVRTQQGPGRVRRISAAVVVNDRSVTEGTGKQIRTVWKSRSSEEMRRLEQLAQAAVGFDQNRGDQVVLENVSFSANSPQIPVVGMERFLREGKELISAQPGLLRTLSIGVCSVLLVFLVLRPAVKEVSTTLRQPMALPPSVSEPSRLEVISRGEIVDFPETSDNMQLAPSKPRSQLHQGVFEQVSEHIRREPIQSTRLIEAWIGTTPEVN